MEATGVEQAMGQSLCCDACHIPFVLSSVLLASLGDLCSSKMINDDMTVPAVARCDGGRLFDMEEEISGV